jgi:hypothetical protein
MWPSGFRKKKPYTSDELSGGGCEHAARRIRKARGSGEIIHISPPPELEGVIHMGPVRPPGGGVITNWYHHRVVRDGDRIFDKMTGPNGMTVDQYSLLFDYWEMFMIRMVEDE